MITDNYINDHHITILYIIIYHVVRLYRIIIWSVFIRVPVMISPYFPKQEPINAKNRPMRPIKVEAPD